MRFAKAHSLGNDFLFVEATALPDGVELGSLSRAICERHRGIGADGLVIFGEAYERFSMRIFNCDGSEAEMSGNGLRCLGAVLRFSGRATGDRIDVNTKAGPRTLELLEAQGPRFLFRAGMGRPENPQLGVPITIDGQTLHATTLSMGNPHATLFTEALDFDVLRKIGPRIERHPHFPNRTNVELVHVLDRRAIEVGFWERGVGETGASGTGASAAAVASILNGKVDDEVRVRCPGGILDVSWAGRDEVRVSGEAVVVAEGDYVGAALLP